MGKLGVVKAKPRCLYVYMNATPNSSGVKPLTEIVPDSSAAVKLLLDSHNESGPGELHEIEEIHTRAETITSLLQGILELHPATHWGINE